MIMKNKEKDTVALYCNCGMDEGISFKVEKYKDEFEGIDISLVTDLFYLNGYSKEKRFKNKLKRIWKILKGEEHCYFNIYVEPEDITELKEFVNQI